MPFEDVNSTDSDWRAGYLPGAVQLHMYQDLSEANLAEIVGRDKAVTGEMRFVAGRAATGDAHWSPDIAATIRERFAAAPIRCADGVYCDREDYRI